MFAYITFPSDFATSTLTIAGSLISDLSPYLSLVLGVLITALAVVVIIRALHK